MTCAVLRYATTILYVSPCPGRQGSFQGVAPSDQPCKAREPMGLTLSARHLCPLLPAHQPVSNGRTLPIPRVLLRLSAATNILIWVGQMSIPCPLCGCASASCYYRPPPPGSGRGAPGGDCRRSSRCLLSISDGFVPWGSSRCLLSILDGFVPARWAGACGGSRCLLSIFDGFVP